MYMKSYFRFSMYCLTMYIAEMKFTFLKLTAAVKKVNFVNRFIQLTESNGISKICFGMTQAARKPILTRSDTIRAVQSQKMVKA